MPVNANTDEHVTQTSRPSGLSETHNYTSFELGGEKKSNVQIMVSKKSSVGHTN